MRVLTRLRRVVPVVLAPVVLLATACSHSEPPSFIPPDPDGPFSTTPPFRITFSPGDDGAGEYSEDGRSIVYTYAVAGRHDRDRCLGVMPAGGGTRIYEKCETRLAYNDSTDWITSGALAADGRLLYLHATSRTNAQVPTTVQLFLADTGSTDRRLLLTFPVPIGAVPTWLADVRWSGASGFTALAQQFTVVPLGGAARDTTFIPIAVARGSITPQGATLQLIAGTEGATSYAVSSDGSQISFTRGGTELFIVPAAGGTATVAATIPIKGLDDRIVGHGCTRNVCVVATAFTPLPPPLGAPLTHELLSVPFGGGAFSSLTLTQSAIWARPRLAPTTNDILTQVRAAAGRDLYLFKGLL